MSRKEDTIDVESVADPIGHINVIPSLNPSRICLSRSGVKCVSGTTHMKPRTAIGWAGKNLTQGIRQC